VLHQSSCSVTKHKSVPLLGDLNLPANEKDLIVQVFVNVMTRTPYSVGPLGTSLSHDTNVTSHTVFRSPSPVTSQLLVCCDHLRRSSSLSIRYPILRWEVPTDWESIHWHNSKCLNYKSTFLYIKHHLGMASSTLSSRATCCAWHSAVLSVQTFEWENIFCPFPWQSWRRTPKQFWKLTNCFYSYILILLNNLVKMSQKLRHPSQDWDLYFLNKPLLSLL
jgi:hypothetical protein